MTFSEAISTCFKKYATFSGRADRSEYWWFILFYFIVSFAAGMLDVLAGSTDGTNMWSGIASLVFFLPNLSVAVRRCHDTNHSGWWILCPIYNIILMFLPSDEGTNEYDAES